MDRKCDISGSASMKWPYPVNYDAIHHIYVDAVVVGGGFAGCCAAIAMARRGLKVAVCDKAPMKRSGNGGAGMDHWNAVWSNPKSPVTPEEAFEQATGYHNQLHNEYIAVKGNWDVLMELNRLGLPIQDSGDDFAGAATRDEDTKLLKAYDYKNMTSIKLRGGYYLKPTIYNELKRYPNALLFHRVMVTNVLTEGGKQRGRVVGATAFSLETGEFYVFHCKSAVLTTGYVCSCWIMSTEITGNSYRWDPNEIGEGMAIAWKCGADVLNMQKNGRVGGNTPFAWPRFGCGFHGNTWYPCNIVDNNGKEIPWENADGEIAETFEERNILPGDAYFGQGVGFKTKDGRKGRVLSLVKDLGDRIRAGEFELPLWADLGSLPEEERRSIWGLMIGNEGKTRYTLYDYYTRWGFNPEKDMLMCPIMPPDAYIHNSCSWFMGIDDAAKAWRTEQRGQGEVATDWDMMTSVPGLFAAGVTSGLEGCSFACSSGFYAGNRMAEYCSQVGAGEIDKEQLRSEHERVYAPVRRAYDPKAYISWKELWAGSCRVMQSDCSEYLDPKILEHGLMWLDSIKQYEMQLTYARNPHELARVLECETRITCSEVFIHACMADIEAKKNGMKRDEYLFCHLDGDKVVPEIRENLYWLKGENQSTYLENYMLRTGGKNQASFAAED